LSLLASAAATVTSSDENCESADAWTASAAAEDNEHSLELLQFKSSPAAGRQREIKDVDTKEVRWDDDYKVIDFTEGSPQMAKENIKTVETDFMNFTEINLPTCNVTMVGFDIKKEGLVSTRAGRIMVGDVRRYEIMVTSTEPEGLMYDVTFGKTAPEELVLEPRNGTVIKEGGLIFVYFTCGFTACKDGDIVVEKVTFYKPGKKPDSK